MKAYDRDYLKDRPLEWLEQENLALEAKQKEIRKVRLQLAQEIDRRVRKGDVPAPAPQVVSPALLEADVEVSGQRKRRFWR